MAITSRFLKTGEGKCYIPLQEGQEGGSGEIQASQPCMEKSGNKCSWKPFRAVGLTAAGAEQLPLTQARHRSALFRT